MEEPVRLELTTPCLKGRCSNQLSYGSMCDMNIKQFTPKLLFCQIFFIFN